MLKKIIKFYYKILDEKLKNGTTIILVIGSLIVSASFFTQNFSSPIYAKSNILEISNLNSKNNLIEINGIKYQLILKNISE